MLSGMEYRLHAVCSPPAELQQWLQLTYEIETRYFDRKRLAADTQLKAAKDMVSWVTIYADYCSPRSQHL